MFLPGNPVDLRRPIKIAQINGAPRDPSSRPVFAQAARAPGQYTFDQQVVDPCRDRDFAGEIPDTFHMHDGGQRANRIRHIVGAMSKSHEASRGAVTAFRLAHMQLKPARSHAAVGYLFF